MAAEDQKSNVEYIKHFLGPFIAILIILFSLTDLYQGAELLTYDWRFKSRNAVFGMPAIDPDLGIIAMDNISVEEEGRYQDWTRDKYTEVVRFLSEAGAQMVGFDIFFSEPSLLAITEDHINKLDDINEASINTLLAKSNHDESFRSAIEDAGNVYLGQILEVPSPDKKISLQEIKEQTKDRKPHVEDAFAVMRSRSPKLMADPEHFLLWRGTEIVPPLKSLRDAAKGFAYAQTLADPDGTRRRYPLVYQYEDIVLPSLALTMVSNRLGVPIENVEVHPGKYILIPNAQVKGGAVKNIKIPIDERGNMNVNWAGEWDETFVHYPHITLRWAWDKWKQNKRLTAVKKLVTENPALKKNPKKIPDALKEIGFTNTQLNREAVGVWFNVSKIEAAIRTDPALDLDAYLEQIGIKKPNKIVASFFKQIKLNNQIAEALLENPEMSLTQLQEKFQEMLPLDIEASMVFVNGLIEAGQLSAGARPLYHYPYAKHDGRNIYPERIKDKILFYGLTADGTSDLSIIPFQGSYPMVGIYPNVFNTILTENFIRRMPSWFNTLLIFLVGILISQTVPRFKVVSGALLVGAMIITYSVIAFIAFTHGGYWLEIAGPLMILVIGYLGHTIYGYLKKEQEKDFVQGAFGHFLSPVVVGQIMENPDMLGQLGGEERVMTAFFSDIASFSTISECLTPIELVTFINEYLSEMCDIVEQYGGTIDKFEGDAIVAFFGAPIYYEDHAVRAVMSCIDQQKKLVELRQRWSLQGALPPALDELRKRWEGQQRTFAQVRIGVTAGPMVVGNMGSRTRTDYTMMGDTVNLAARFESGQKVYGTNVMVNDLIYNQVKDLVEARKLDVLQVVGKEEPVSAYEILERKGELSDKQYALLDLYGQGMAAFEAYEFVAAQELFEKCLALDPLDGPSALYLDRCEDFAENKPSDLVFRATDK